MKIRIKSRQTGLIDLISSNLSFITDGHLALTAKTHGKGFHKLLRTFVSDITVKKSGKELFEVGTGRRIALCENVRLLPTLKEGNEDRYLLSVRSKENI